jgi:hypothetical protein
LARTLLSLARVERLLGWPLQARAAGHEGAVLLRSVPLGKPAGEPDVEVPPDADDVLRGLGPAVVALLERYRRDDVDSRASGIPVGLGEAKDGAWVVLEADAKLEREGLTEPTLPEGWSRLSERGRALARALVAREREVPGEP